MGLCTNAPTKPKANKGLFVVSHELMRGVIMCAQCTHVFPKAVAAMASRGAAPGTVRL